MTQSKLKRHIITQLILIMFGLIFNHLSKSRKGLIQEKLAESVQNGRFFCGVL